MEQRDKQKTKNLQRLKGCPPPPDINHVINQETEYALMGAQAGQEVNTNII